MKRKDVIDTLISKLMSATVIRKPFKHLVIDDIFDVKFASRLQEGFLEYSDPRYVSYESVIESKKTCNRWDLFGADLYTYFSSICADSISSLISRIFECSLIADFGLHGGGMHVHQYGGSLNPHLDYSRHPKLGLERKINAILYLTENFQPGDGGALGLWEQAGNSKCGWLAKEIDPIFNRLVVFQTSDISWHGLSQPYRPQSRSLRKSLAAYYVDEKELGLQSRPRARFSPTSDQHGDQTIADAILERQQ